MDKYIIHTDGGSRGNPGPAALGVVIEGSIEEKAALPKAGELHLLRRNSESRLVQKWEYGEYLGERTNNQAEYEAVAFALKKLKQLIGSDKAAKAAVEVRLDSELISKQLNGKYKIKEKDMQSFFIEVWNLRLDFGKVIFKHIPREENEDADKIVNQALDQEASKLDL